MDAALLPSLLLDRLLWTSLQAAILAGLVALLLRWLPRLPAGARCALWWLVGLQAIVGLAWQAPVHVPLPTPIARVAPAPPAHAAAASARDATPPVDTYDLAAPAPPAHAHIAPMQSTAAPAARPLHALPWQMALVALWLAGLLIQLPGLVRRYREHRHLRRTARPLDDRALLAECRAQAQRLGLRRCPTLKASSAVTSPQVSGWRHPVLLWPARQRLSAAEDRLALAHELAHLRRGDLCLGLVPALAERLLFFHPAVHWAAHEYALHREAACDIQALRHLDAVSGDYGKLLLRLGVARPLPHCLGGASTTFRHLKRRLTMLQQSPRALPRGWSWALVALIALIGVLPYRGVAAQQANAPAQAATVAHAPTTWIASSAPPPPSAPPAAALASLAPAAALPSTMSLPPPAPAAPPIPAVPPAPTAPAAPAVPAVPPAPPAPPAPAVSPTPAAPPVPAIPAAPPTPPAAPDFGFHAHHADIDIGPDTSPDIVLFDHGRLLLRGDQAFANAVKQRPRTDRPLLWIRRDGKDYITHDPATIERMSRIWAPPAELARKRGRLAAEQGALAGRRAGLSARTAAMGRVRARLAAQQARLASASVTRKQQTAALEARARAREAQARMSAAAARRTAAARAQALEARSAQLQQQQAAIHGRPEARQALQAQLNRLEAQQTALAAQQRTAARSVQNEARLRKQEFAAHEASARRAAAARAKALQARAAQLQKQQAAAHAKIQAQDQALETQQAALEKQRAALASDYRAAKHRAERATREFVNHALANGLIQAVPAH